MNKIILIIIMLISPYICLSNDLQSNKTEPPPPVEKNQSTDTKENSHYLVGLNLYFSMQYWPSNQKDYENKNGLGFGALLGIGYKTDTYKILIGPTFWNNVWENDYSNNGSFQKIYVKLNDSGLASYLLYNNIFLELGTGSTVLNSGLFLNDKEHLFSYNNSRYYFNSISFGYNKDNLILGLGTKLYTNYAVNYDHLNFIFGLSF